MLRLAHIEAVNVEVCSKCNANCTFCSRKETVRPYGEHLLTLTDMKRLPQTFIRRIKRMSFGGNFGDLCCNAEFVEIAAYMRSINPTIRLEGDTNGSFQSESWWRAVGKSFQNGAMVFALDGLEDTHRHYRRGTQFKKIMKNIQTFTSSGGIAYWKFIAFEHNEHQIDEAEKKAEAIGCKRFTVITSRDYNTTYKKPKNIDLKIKREVYADHWDLLPEDKRYATCRPYSNKSIYIAADGSVHPCCLAHCMFITEHNKNFKFILPLIEKNLADINFKTTPLEEIVSGAYFKAAMQQSKNNRYCITKCNPNRKLIRKKLIIYDRIFD